MVAIKVERSSTLVQMYMSNEAQHLKDLKTDGSMLP